MKTLMTASAIALLSTSAAMAECSWGKSASYTDGAMAEATTVEPMEASPIASACDGVQASDGFVCVEDGEGGFAFVAETALPDLTVLDPQQG